ncbi:hypothetical protein DFQ27_008257 [Actinomortierella ambigua]|uniref:Phosphatase n=1 Tax=Actinomortierella ambigua TaxID=1343610 RepID=A0A9P6TYJ6_9FUNG|nr:hypothetical protein DFQ27_008257 [Actinomortierella ambigua]
MPFTTSFKRLAVFDFDWTLVEADSDHWVMQELSPSLRDIQMVEEGVVQWTDLQDKLLGMLHEKGFRRSQLEATLQNIPFTTEMIEALEQLKSQGTYICILSDANTVYIDIILKAYGISHLIDRVITNPAYYDETERLHVQRHHGLDLPPHGCPNPCAANLCKGQELDALMAVEDYDQVIYGGDGTNDFCAALHLRPQDTVLARSGLGLEKQIKSSAGRLKANVKYWQSTKDVLRFVRELCDASSTASTIQPAKQDRVDRSTSSSRMSLDSTSSTAVDEHEYINDERSKVPATPMVTAEPIAVAQ